MARGPVRVAVCELRAAQEGIAKCGGQFVKNASAVFARHVKALQARCALCCLLSMGHT